MNIEPVGPLAIKLKVLSPLIREGVIPKPAYATDGAAAMDLHACIAEPLLIPAGGRVGVPTGIAFELPGPHVVALVFPRSGLASKHGIALSNAVGVIDSDYRGEVICLVKNESAADFQIQPGDRLAQLGFFPVFRGIWEEVDALAETDRGAGGFGSTGRGISTAEPLK
ncbi:dUTP pyrophosphatase [Hydrogenispora ethanolica]|uniref:Deoxyuridine 5'-triphosphate nucleotidohydrolase n=1 Tax=Hydrogenispora ethanolica TaxID=1082276 RepID=A0A4R1S4K6_HYDET|nr:dUTP diphosphatase [Hydrogenispora ethanolica]TCL74141.1 dUTP pyrophosphatase [Hydrogenispora ethanolica]